MDDPVSLFRDLAYEYAFRVYGGQHSEAHATRVKPLAERYADQTTEKFRRANPAARLRLVREHAPSRPTTTGPHYR